jgi:hypothetical protein
MRIAPHLASMSLLAQAKQDAMQCNTEPAATLKPAEAQIMLELIDELPLQLLNVVLHAMQGLLE